MGEDMSGKGRECQRVFLKKAYAVRVGREKPVEYSMTVEQALKKAGL